MARPARCLNYWLGSDTDSLIRCLPPVWSFLLLMMPILSFGDRLALSWSTLASLVQNEAHFTHGSLSVLYPSNVRFVSSFNAFPSLLSLPFDESIVIPSTLLMLTGAWAVRICMDRLTPSVMLLQGLKGDESITRSLFPNPAGGIAMFDGQGFPRSIIRVILRYTRNVRTLSKLTCEAPE